MTDRPSKRWKSAVVALALAILFPAALQAEENGALGDKPVLVHALTLERDVGKGTVIGEGAVDLAYGDLRLRADRVVVHEKSREVIADGNVVLDEGENRLQGEHLELNLDTRTGFIEKGQGFAEPYFFAGTLIEKPGFNRYRIRKGSFTSCEGEVPSWKFTSPDTTMKLDDRVTTKHPAMWVKKLPVLYLPYATLPLKKERSSGILIPQVRYNENFGWELRNALYWAPRDNFDATLRLDWFENLGWGPGLEVRYIAAPGTYGRFDSFYIDETDGLESWMVSYEHQHSLPKGWRGQVDLFSMSDRDYANRFGNTLEIKGTEKITSHFALSKTWSYYDVVFSGRYEESLLTEKESTITRLPELTVDRTRSRVGRSDLFWRFTFEGAALKSENVEDIFVVPTAANIDTLIGAQEETEEEQILLSQETKIETNRLHIAPELSYPKALGSWGSFTPTFTYFATYYSEDLEGESHTRGIPAASLSVDGPRVYRIFDSSGSGAIEKVKHVIEPRVSYVYAPDVDQSTIPQFDLIDFIPDENTLVYSLTNTLLGKVASAGRGGISRTRALLRVKLLQTDAYGHVRATVKVPIAGLPPRDGRFDVAGAVGAAGFLHVVKDLDMKEPYRGMVQLVSSEIAEDLAYYFTTSEQTPSSVALGVELGQQAEVVSAGGFLVQLMPGADDALADRLTERLGSLPPTTTLLRQGASPESIVEQILGGFPYRTLGTTALEFACSCSEQQIRGLLRTMGKEELDRIIEEDGEAEVTCEYCKEAYLVDRGSLQEIRASL